MICNAKDLAVAIEWCRREQVLEEFPRSDSFDVVTFRGAQIVASATEPSRQQWSISTSSLVQPLRVAPWVIDMIRVMGEGAPLE